MSGEEITALQSADDIYLSLHPAEGYGLTIHEWLLTGRPVVANKWSAKAEFGPKFETYYPVKYTLTQYSDWMNAFPGPSFLWADADTHHAAEILK